MPDTPAPEKKPNAQPLTPEQEEEAKLAQAMKLGLTEQETADYLELSLEQFRTRIDRSPTLRQIARGARSQGLIDLLEKVMKGEHWQAYKFIIERNWPLPVEAPPTKDDDEVEPGVLEPLRAVRATMSAKQAARMPELLAIGCAVDNARQSQLNESESELLCRLIDKNAYFAPSQESLPPTPSSPQNPTCAPSSTSPGTSSNPPPPSSPAGTSI